MRSYADVRQITKIGLEYGANRCLRNTRDLFDGLMRYHTKNVDKVRADNSHIIRPGEEAHSDFIVESRRFQRSIWIVLAHSTT